MKLFLFIMANVVLHIKTVWAQSIQIIDFVPGYSKTYTLRSEGKINLANYKVINGTGSIEHNTFYPTDKALFETKGVVVLSNGAHEIKFNVPYLQDIRFNLYTDSIKIVNQLNYYVNVEGNFGDNKYYPLNEDFIELSSNQVAIEGMSLVFKDKKYDSVQFTATYKSNKNIYIAKTMYIQKRVDEEDLKVDSKQENNLKLVSRKKTKRKKSK